MKIGNILTIVIVAFIVLLGVNYVNNKENTQDYTFQNTDNTYQDQDDSNNSSSVVEDVVLKLPTKYISGQMNWPPVVEQSLEAYECLVGDTGGDIPTITEERNINDKTFCISSMAEGTAGSRFITYTYRTGTPSGSSVTSFILRYSDCGVYGDAEMAECKEVQKTFDLDSLIGLLDW